ncbi:MAG: 23S rRNA (uracil(1939)-C(5))-methyltransferase RlmD [Spirochaetia bacterium]|nr:23S rRNA (uracil(1939)-C(5))-methyltransferase RlmD [Spirochaetia bacterium]
MYNKDNKGGSRHNGHGKPAGHNRSGGPGKFGGPGNYSGSRNFNGPGNDRVYRGGRPGNFGAPRSSESQEAMDAREFSDSRDYGERREFGGREKSIPGVPVRVGYEIDVEIDDLAYGGDAVARYKNFTIFIPYGVPGSFVKAKVTDVKKNFASARIVRVIRESGMDARPPCPYFGQCGGCDWMNVKYSSQIWHKSKIVKFMLEKSAGMPNIKVADIVTYPEPYGYRNRSQYKLRLLNDKIEMGFFKARSHDIIPVDKCLILDPKINEVAAHIKTVLNEKKSEITIFDEDSRRGYLRHIAIRVNSKKESLVTFVVYGKEEKPFLEYAAAYLKEKVEGLKGVVVNFNMEDGNAIFGGREKVLTGRGYITETAAGMDFDLDSGAFFQVNVSMLEKMAEFVRKYTANGSSVLDLYGGVGALTMPSRDKFREIYVVEIDEGAARKLHAMTERNHINNVTVINGRAEDAVERVLNEHHIDVAVIDPPRKGIHPHVISVLKRMKVPNIIYISCNPASFARDIKELKEVYYLKDVVPLDQFAQTYHVEVMARLEAK